MHTYLTDDELLFASRLLLVTAWAHFPEGNETMVSVRGPISFKWGSIVSVVEQVNKHDCKKQNKKLIDWFEAQRNIKVGLSW